MTHLCLGSPYVKAEHRGKAQLPPPHGCGELQMADCPFQVKGRLLTSDLESRPRTFNVWDVQISGGVNLDGTARI